MMESYENDVRKYVIDLVACRQRVLPRHLQEAKPGLAGALLPPLGVPAVHGVDPVGVDLLHLVADFVDVHWRKRPGQRQRGVDDPSDVALGHVVAELAEYLPRRGRKASDGSEVDEANLVVGHDHQVCRMRIGVKEQLFLRFRSMMTTSLLASALGSIPI